MSTHADDLRYRMIKQHFGATHRTFADIARKTGVSPAMVTMVAQGRRVSRKVRRVLARTMAMKYEELWGES